jgi:RimJ/RimL family protein N-acetyltransferase
MLIFKKLDLASLNIVKSFFDKKKSLMCDYSLGEKFLWESIYKTSYAIEHNTLIMLENYDQEKMCFYYPIGDDIEYAFSLMEEYTLEKGIRLEFCCLDDEEALLIKKRYPHAEIINNIDWNDYLYDANSLMSFSGKHLAGQRNHLHHFINMFPDYKFNIASKNDIPLLHAFMSTLKEKTIFPNSHAEYEFMAADRLIDNMFALNMHCGFITINNEIIGYTIGEIIASCLFVHIEKAFREYDGIYQALVYNFSNHFKDQILYINREEDDGDLGLRLSKTQYHPIKMVTKNFAYIRNNIDFLKAVPQIVTDRLIIDALNFESSPIYYHLATNDVLNKLWGYNYKNDVNDTDTINAKYFYDVVNNDFKNKDDVSFILYLKDKTMIGEIVAYEFQNDNSCTIGFRLFAEYQHQGFMYEALKEVVNFLFTKLNYKYVLSKCYKNNIPSKKLIEKMHYEKINEDEDFFYYRLLNNSNL